jgi:hypothetical protein
MPRQVERRDADDDYTQMLLGQAQLVANKAIDALRQAKQRERDLAAAQSEQTHADARRAPALEGRRGV